MLSYLPYMIYRLGNILYSARLPFIPTLFMLVNRVIFSCYIPSSAKIGKGTRFSYGGAAIVIHANSVIGKGCTIGPCVTIGGRSGHKNVPKIGDNVYIAGGAKILGPINIGENSIIAANAIVIEDVPPNSIVTGTKSKITEMKRPYAEYF